MAKTNKDDRNAFKAGVFIVVSIVLIIAVIVSIKGVGRLIEPQQVRTATFTLADDVGGLRVGDDVRVGGLKVGIVKSLAIERQTEGGAGQQPKILVTFDLPERIVLREGARIGVQNTVTGTSWLNFDNLGAGAPIAENVPLVGRPGSMTQILNTVQELGPELKQIAKDVRTVTLPKVNTTIDNASGLLGDARGELKPVLERYHTASARLAEALTQVRDLLGDSKGRHPHDHREFERHHRHAEGNPAAGHEQGRYRAGEGEHEPRQRAGRAEGPDAHDGERQEHQRRRAVHSRPQQDAHRRARPIRQGSRRQPQIRHRRNPPQPLASPL
jgi:hypothetical protein